MNTGNIGAGVLFGISFFISSRSLNHEQLRYYLIISGLGIMIIFSSGFSPNSTLAPFPAWSITSLSFILPASFLLMIGLDSETYYIATDTILRKFFHKHKDKFELFRALGFKKHLKLHNKKFKKYCIKNSISLKLKQCLSHYQNQKIFNNILIKY